MPSENAAVLELVRRYRDNIQEYRANLNETQTRREFIDPLFELLGWDVANTRGYAESYKSVVHEDQLTIEGRSKAPDYSFRVGTLRKFFLEAKRPGVNITSDAPSAYQLRRYGWNGKLPFSILTNFEHLAVYDCRVKPSAQDKASAARVLLVTFENYPERWDEIASLFSFDAVMRGAFDRFSVDRRPRRGTTTVDDDFLAEIERWRDVLARSIYRHNRQVNRYQLNDAVQKTIDRIIFLRIAEDLGMEPTDSLLSVTRGPGVYARLLEVFLRADERYNSGLFHFRHGEGRHSEIDSLTPGLHIPDATVRSIVEHLYPPLSDYEFRVIPADILGQIYERFLGRTISLKGTSILIEDKPDVKKAGGVFYTPTYVVRYIVAAVLDPLFRGRSVGEVSGVPAGRPKRILDPACGSGSFLIEVYQYLLNWHLAKYIEDNPESYARGRHPKLFRSGNGYELTISERKRILLTHIYGVDVDPQAVEVTKLSLLLKVLQGESRDFIASQMNIFQQSVLPDLDGNIKCGNSLVQSDFFGLFSEKAFSDEDLHKINAFSWQRRFPLPMRDGFDVVLGNPPYGALFLDEEKIYFQNVFPHQNYQAESYLLFLEKAVSSLLAPTGRLGMIIPNPWLTNLLQRNLRQFILESTNVEQIVHFTFQVFKRAKATVDTEIVILAKGIRQQEPVAYIVEQVAPDGTIHIADASRIEHSQADWLSGRGDSINIFLDHASRSLARRLFSAGPPLASEFYTSVGMKPYQKGKGVPRQTEADVKGRVFDAMLPETEEHRAYLRGSDIRRFWAEDGPAGYIRYGRWLAEPRESARFDTELKIFVRQTGDSLVAAVDTNRLLAMNNLHVLVPRAAPDVAWFAVGLLNTRVMNWCYQALNPEMGEGLAEVKKANLDRLPLPDTSKLREEIGSLARRITETVTALRRAQTQREKELLREQLSGENERLNALAFEIFAVSPEERTLIEASQTAHSVDPDL